MVVGVDRKTLNDIVFSWVKNDTQKLAEHPAQIIILEEIRMQLEAFKKYAVSIGKNEVAEIYDRTLFIINQIIIEKNVQEEDARQAEKDDMFFALKMNAVNIADRKV